MLKSNRPFLPTNRQPTAIPHLTMRRSFTTQFEPTVPNGVPLVNQPTVLYATCGPWPIEPIYAMQVPIETDPENPQTCWVNVPITFVGGRISFPTAADLQALEIGLASVTPL